MTTVDTIQLDDEGEVVDDDSVSEEHSYHADTIRQDLHHDVITETHRFPIDGTIDDDSAEVVDPSSYPTLPTDCDRRISRAARSLLVRHLRSILMSATKKYKMDASSNDMDLESATVWQLLEYSLAPQAYSSDSKCPLLPSRDSLRHDEEHSLVLLPPPRNTASRLGISIRSALFRIPKTSWWKTPAYQCGFCGKLFISRFYLDRHLDAHHSNATTSQQKQSMICPAVSWCPGLTSCAQHALEIEPYYGPGSGQWSHQDRNEVKRHLEAQVRGLSPHCDEAVMQQTKRRCSEMMQECFGETSATEMRQAYIHQHLQQSLCQPISCPDRLHQLFFAATAHSNQAAAMMMQHVHEWHDEWEDYYAHHHTLGMLGMALIIGILWWYASYLWHASTNYCGSYRWMRQKDPKGTRLLKKRSSSSLSQFAKKKLLGSFSSSSKRASKTKRQ
jgi:hypothetical protein